VNRINLNMKNDLITQFAALRAAVSLLAESRSWWKSDFHGASSKDFLLYIFPKSMNVQVACANMTARKFVDDEVGANYYHLFRLPVSVEEMVAKSVRNQAEGSVSSEVSALHLMKKLSGDMSTDGKVGPKHIGSIHLLNQDVLQAFATEYLNAFENDYQVHPYLN